MSLMREAGRAPRRGAMARWRFNPWRSTLIAVGALDQDFDGSSRTGQERLQIVRDYALTVFGKSATAAHWLGQTNAAVLDGTAVVSAACQCLDGFRQAMFELFRLQRRLGPGAGP